MGFHDWRHTMQYLIGGLIILGLAIKIALNAGPIPTGAETPPSAKTGTEDARASVDSWERKA